MVVSGLWHGASWTFVLWGGLHAGFLSIERITRWPALLNRIPRIGLWLATPIVLMQVWVAWVFFRAESIEQAFYIVRLMFSFVGEIDVGVKGGGLTAAMYLCIGILREIYCRIAASRNLLKYDWMDICTIAAMIVACVFLRGPGEAFIYFQF